MNKRTVSSESELQKLNDFIEVNKVISENKEHINEERN